MAVLLEAYSLLVRNEDLDSAYPTGAAGYLQDAPTMHCCTDGTLTRVGFMAEADVRREAARLVAIGAIRGIEDAAVVAADNTEVPSWLVLGTHGATPCIWLQGEPIGDLAVPASWSPGQLQRFDEAEMAEHLEHLRTEDGGEVYLDRRTGELLYVGRTAGSRSPLSEEEAERLERIRLKAWSLLKPFLGLSDRAPKSPHGFFARRSVRKGLTLLAEVIEAAPDIYSNYWLRGMVRRTLEDGEGSLTDLARAYELEPNHADVAREYSYACLSMGEGEEAVRVARRNLAANVDDAGLRSNLALALLAAGRIDDAWMTASQAAAADPHDPITQNLLVLIGKVVAGELPCPDRYPP